MAKHKKAEPMPFDDPAVEVAALPPMPPRRRVRFPGPSEFGLPEEEQAAEDALLLSYNESELAWLMSTNVTRYRRYLEITGQLVIEEEGGPPISVDVPYTSQVGVPEAPTDTVNCTMGNWENEPTEYLYTWFLNGGEVSSGAENTKTFTTEDIGGTVTCVVVATNAAGSTEAIPSNPVTLLDWNPPAVMAAEAPVVEPPPFYEEEKEDC